MDKQVPDITLIAHDLRSTYNVGSILRTCDGLGVKKFIATGTTPYPEIEHDIRLPHIAKRANLQIVKTALGAEDSVKILHAEITKVISQLKSEGKSVYALEQSNDSKLLGTFKVNYPMVLIVGNEPEGLPAEILSLCDDVIEIPMKGLKESFNVSVATAIALWELTNRTKTS